MKRAFPYALFAAVTLAVFWKFIFLGQTLHAVVLLESQLGLPTKESGGWFPQEHPRAQVADNILLLNGHLRRYNEGLKSGELRLWNPSLCCGLPAYADPMLHPFYPPQILLHAALPPDPAYELFLLLHLFFSGAAMYWLARGLGRSDLAGAAAGLVWMLLGYNAKWFSTGILAGVSVWGPIALLLLHRAFERRDLSRAAAAGIATGMAVLGSHPQHAFHVGLFTVGWLLVLGLQKGGDRPFLLRAGLLYGFLSVGVGLAGILTRLDTIANGYRNPGADFDFLYGAPWTLPLHVFDAIAGKAAYFEKQSLEFEFTFHAGLAAVALAVVGAVRRFDDRRVRFLAFVALGTLAVAFLKPLAFAIRVIPLLQLSPPSRWLFVFGFPASLLAAYGWDALQERAGRIPLVVASVAAVAGTAVAAIFRNASAVEALLGFALVAAAAMTLRRSARTASLLAFAAILFELLPPQLQANRHVDPGPLHRLPASVETARGREKEPWRGTGSLGAPNSDAYARQVQEDRAGLDTLLITDLSDGNNLLSLFGVENAAGFEAIMPDSYVKYALAAGAALAPGGRATVFARFPGRLVDAMNLKYAFLPKPIQAPARFRRIFGDFGTIDLYENTAALPRAWLVGRATAVRDEQEAVERIRAADFDPGTRVILETLEEIPPSAGTAEGTVAVSQKGSDRIDLAVSARAPSFLVLADNDYPGWEAELDGKPVPHYRANVAFRAVAVPAGEHSVVFRFRPESARHGALASLGFLLLGAGLVVRLRRRKEPPC